MPKYAQSALKRTVWNLSLGREEAAAEKRASALRHEHDKLLAELDKPNGARRVEMMITAQSVDEQIARTERRHQVQDLPNHGGLIVPLATHHWRRIPEIIANSDDAPTPEDKYRQLAFSQALAFGDTTRTGPIPNLPQPERPTDHVDLILYEAHRQMLEAALSEIAPRASSGDPALRLTALLEDYIKSAGVRDSTATHYRKMIRPLIETTGDHELPKYTQAKLKSYRDHLIEATEASPQTIEKRFATLKALWRWAAEEKSDVWPDLTFPAIRLPKVTQSTEESRWQAFDDAQIKEVWNLVSEAWGPDSASRLAPERRADFLMAFRVMLWTGMRPSEVFKLDASNVADGILMIRETKTLSRKLPITKHLSDLPQFLSDGGFGSVRGMSKAADKMSDYFTKLIRPKMPNDRLVLYSLKDTLVGRLQRLDVGDDLIRAVIGHKSGQGKLRHYKTGLGETPEGRAKIKAALDKISYW
ncbi:hypothetical protein BMI87_20575 [Thioclava sp. F28-4]|nr:hypothetical protein BMI87_20575 [Thioclava sp. F28-4]